MVPSCCHRKKKERERSTIKIDAVIGYQKRIMFLTLLFASSWKQQKMGAWRSDLI
jgi:hypothetical protein